MLIWESCNYIRLSTHTESITLQKLKKTVSRAVTPLFNFSLNKHKLKGKVQSIFPSDNGHPRESWALIFHLGSTTPTPSDQHLTSRVFLGAGWGSSRVPGLDAGCSDRCLKVSRQQHRSRCARAARDGICCSHTDGQGQQPWEQQGCESCPCGRAHTWRCSGSAPSPGAALGGRCQSKEPRHHTAMLSLKFKALCSNSPILLYREGFCLLMLPKLSPQKWESAQAPSAQELQDFGLGLFISVRFFGAQGCADSLPFQRILAVQAPGGIKQDGT